MNDLARVTNGLNIRRPKESQNPERNEDQGMHYTLWRRLIHSAGVSASRPSQPRCARWRAVDRHQHKRQRQRTTDTNIYDESDSSIRSLPYCTAFWNRYRAVRTYAFLFNVRGYTLANMGSCCPITAADALTWCSAFSVKLTPALYRTLRYDY